MEKNIITRDIPSYIERGRKIIFEDKYNEWINCINICLSKECNRPTLILDVLDIMEAIEVTDDITEVKELLTSLNLDNDTEKLLRTIVCKFSKKGPNFYESTAKAKLSDSTIEYLEKKKKQNKTLEEKELIKNKIYKFNMK